MLPEKITYPNFTSARETYEAASKELEAIREAASKYCKLVTDGDKVLLINAIGENLLTFHRIGEGKIVIGRKLETPEDFEGEDPDLARLLLEMEEYRKQDEATVLAEVRDNLRKKGYFFEE